MLLHGSGPESRWGPNRFLADRLARAGVAALIYDKRGSGVSGGDWRKASFADLAEDALAGVRLLAARADIDPAKIGLLGYSQEGAIAPLAATRAPNAIAFIVAEDTFAGPQMDQDVYRVRTALADLKLSPPQAATAMRVYADFVDAARGAKSVDGFLRAAERYKRASWYAWMDFPRRDSWIWAWGKLNANSIRCHCGARCTSRCCWCTGKRGASPRKHRENQRRTRQIAHAARRRDHFRGATQSHHSARSKRPVLLVAHSAARDRTDRQLDLRTHPIRQKALNCGRADKNGRCEPRPFLYDVGRSVEGRPTRPDLPTTAGMAIP